MQGEKLIEIGPEVPVEARPPEPCLLVIFGAGGDLTRRELVPSLYELFQQGLSPKRFAVIGFSWGDWDDDGFREAMREPVAAQCPFEEEEWSDLSKRLHFMNGDFRSPASEDYAIPSPRRSPAPRSRSSGCA